VGDILQSFFFSPVQSINGIVVGAGPVFLYPTATRDEISANQFAAGPTLVALKQENGFTIGILANHLWGIGNPGRNGLGGGSILGDDGSTIILPLVYRLASMRAISSRSFPTRSRAKPRSRSRPIHLQLDCPSMDRAGRGRREPGAQDRKPADRPYGDGEILGCPAGRGAFLGGALRSHVLVPEVRNEPGVLRARREVLKERA
jgi:hypothetical protein